MYWSLFVDCLLLNWTAQPLAWSFHYQDLDHDVEFESKK